ncbi:hypothetical protein ACHAWF_003327 [Thalassiosira exigua]
MVPGFLTAFASATSYAIAASALSSYQHPCLRGARLPSTFEPCIISHMNMYNNIGRSRREVGLSMAPPGLWHDLAAAEEQDFFVSDAQFVHLGPAARILTEEFYSQRTTFISFQVERLKTVLSLESTFPNQTNSLRKEGTPRPLQRMIVACNAKDGRVIGFAEVDARPLGMKNNGISTDTVPEYSSSNGDVLRSYMYNLAVDKKWKRRGVASALVEACENFVIDMHDSCAEKRLYLRVRKCNQAAVSLYEKLGYIEMDPEEISLSKEDINSGSLEDGELILFAKDLSKDTECALD